MNFEILTYAFMQRAIICGIAISLMCSLIGIFLVLRKQSLFGDALAHAAFGGIAAGLYLGIYPLWAAFAVSVSSALALTKIKQKFQISSDATVAILLSSGLAMGVILISMAKGFTVDIFSFLFGSILLVSLQNTLLILGLCGTVLVIILILYKKLVYTTFSEEQAKVSGIAVDKLNYLFVVIAAITVVSSMQLVGILLTSSLIVVPNVTAILFSRGFKQTAILSMSFAVFSSIVGILSSYVLNVAPGGMIVLISIIIFGVSLGIKSLRTRNKFVGKSINITKA
ncbi:MAG TPA: metal ABC transporter permease [Candidatus Nitrosotalea sp.]|nr:metal ABC transporter permease [Candidatus Nitrosotalea sp.]